MLLFSTLITDPVSHQLILVSLPFVAVLPVFLTAFEMWLMVVSVPLLPAIIVASSRYRVELAALCHRALAWALRLMRGKVCVRSTHAYVFSNCTHGKVDSVLETFDLYADTHPSFCISPQIGQYTR